MCDAAFLEKEGMSSYGISMYFDRSLVFAGVIFRGSCCSAKEAETRRSPVQKERQRTLEFLESTYARMLSY